MKKQDDAAVTPFLVGMKLSETLSMQSANAEETPAEHAQRMVDGYAEIAQRGGVTLGMGFVRDLAMRSIQIGVELLRIAERHDGFKISCVYCGGARSALSTTGQTVTQPMVLAHEHCIQEELRGAAAGN